MILCINTQDKNVVEVALRNTQGKLVASLSEQNKYGSQVLLPLIMKLLETVPCNLSAIQGVEVSTGPGSFVGLRVGVSVANALGFALGIPVNGKKIETDLIY